MTEAEAFYISIAQQLPDTIQTRMFGKPVFKKGGKAFVAFHDDAMVFKLTGEAHHEAISLDGSQLFDPSGKKRPMKEWVQVPYVHRHKWAAFAEAAMEYVRGKG
ncbi:MAG TPA: hypothetical protein VEC36_10290 [Patescibacteria group bacterium]|nr:hypothetical protein [Patescibacteria group bacterium]